MKRNAKYMKKYFKMKYSSMSKKQDFIVDRQYCGRS